MKFTFKKEDEHGEATIVFNGEELEEVVAEFEKFLRATGFDLGDNKFALINFSELEAGYDYGEEGFGEEGEEGEGNEGGESGGGSGSGTSH